jgi:hypothetical protein
VDLHNACNLAENFRFESWQGRNFFSHSILRRIAQRM